MGGDRRSEALEAHAPMILGWLEDTPDLFLREIVSRLADAGVETSAMSVARLLARHGITRKKDGGCGRAGARRHCPRPR